MKPVAQALVATLTIQAWVVAGANTVPVLGPIVTADFGLPASAVGYYTSATNAAAMIAALAAGGFVRRYGALRVSQSMLAFAGMGLAGLALGILPLAVLAAFMLGTAYGLANPASSHLLARHTPAAIRARIFSLKQTSVPIGIAFAGLLVPVLATLFGWQVAALCLATASALLILVFQPWRARLDDDADPETPIAFGNIVDPVRMVMADRALRRLVLASMAYSMAQFCFTAFYVTFLAERVAMTPVESGPILSLALGVSVFARLALGWLADRTSTRAVLATVGFGIAALAFVATEVDRDWSWTALALLGAGFGLTAVSWNGVFLAETAALAPPEKVSVATGGAMFFTLSGAFVGPAAFAALVDLTGTFDSGFLLVGGLALVSGIVYALPPARRPAP